METEFSRIITLLRKEKKLSQKRVAKDLNISQGLLSHYEKGVRECGIDFIIKVAEYYDVSCDYLLGRTAQRKTETPSDTEQKKEKSVTYGNSLTQLNKELISNSTAILFELAQQTENKNFQVMLSDYLMATIYRLFRMIHSANSKNPQAMFSLPNEFYNGYTDAFQRIREVEMNALLKGISVNNLPSVARNKIPEISEELLLSEYKEYATSIINVIKLTENNLKK